MPRSVYLTRSLAVLRLQRELEHRSYPRIQMGLIVALTGGTGLVASFLLLQAGMHSMAVRYPAALGAAYIGFLFLLWIWLRFKADDLASLADLVPNVGPGGQAPSARCGGGGDFGGAGARGAFDGQGFLPSGASSPLSSLGDAAGVKAEAEELAIPIVAVVLALGLALASLYIVYLAPVLFAELLLDGALSYALYHRLRDTERSHWLMTAVRRTLVPFVLTAVFLALVGAGMAACAPGARSIGEFARQVGART